VEGKLIGDALEDIRGPQAAHSRAGLPTLRSLDTLIAPMTVRFVLVLLVSVPTAHASAFYCDPINGSTQGDGSTDRPWRTIEALLQARLIQYCDQNRKPANPSAPVKAGDTVLLRSGWESLHLHVRHGQLDRPVAPGEPADRR